MAARKCSICNLRPVPSLKARQDAGMSSDMDYCEPCFEFAGWENSHSDQSHEEIIKDRAEIEAGATLARLKEIAASYRIKLDRTQRTKPTVTAAILDFFNHFQSELEDCWVCHPELDKSSKEYVARESGISRKGQVIHAKGDVNAKAKVITDAIEAVSGTAKVTKAKNGTVTLRGEVPSGAIEVHWDSHGRYQYGPSVFTPKGSDRKNKIRNVSEALRLIARVA